MRRIPCILFCLILSLAFSLHLLPQTSQSAPAKKAAPKAAPAGPAAITNRDVIKMLQAKLSDDIIIAKIRQSKTHFDTSVDGLVALRTAGASDRLITFIMDPGSTPAPAPSASAAPAAAPEPASAPKYTGPATNRTHDAASTVSTVAVKSESPTPIMMSAAPQNYGVYIVAKGKMEQLGRIQTKVQVSKFRSLIKGYVPFVRNKIDINIPGAHSTSRYELVRPTFYAYFPASRDVSKFKLLQCKITGQKFDQRTVANASIMFSTEQNQDEVPLDIGPTNTKDLYRIFPREDLPAGEFAFVEGNSGSQSSSNIEIIDVYDFGIDRKEEKMPLKDYLATQSTATMIADTSFMEWTREDCKKIIDDRDGHTGLTGSLMGWFKRQYATLDVYWADEQFAKAFSRLEMMDRDLTPEQTRKLAGSLVSTDNSKFYVVVSVGGKIGSGRLIGANEGERIMRPFDATLSNEKEKDIVPAKRLEFIGGYAGLWKVEFDQKSIRGPLMGDATTPYLVFEARLNQNLDFKAKFDMDKIGNNPANASGTASATPNE